MTASITPLYAGLVALLFLALSMRVARYRRANQLSVGDYGDKKLEARMRAQANCAEYAPIGLILILLVELQGAPVIAVHILGLMLVLGRAMHAYGFSKHPQIIPLRAGGMILTFSVLLFGSLGLIGHSLF
jgi:uncharacterized membrane protein YecN with MAPEG domain